MDQKQKALLDNCARFLKEKFPSSLLGQEEAHFFSAEVYSRFAAQHNGDHEKAAAAFQDCLNWRKEYKPHLIDPETECKAALHSKFLLSGGLDKEGGGVIVLTLADPSFKDVPKAERTRLFVWVLEELARRGREHFIFIADFSLVGKEKDPQGVATRNETAAIMDKYYPERMRLSLMYNPPWFISSFGAISNAFMSSKLKAKVRTNCKTKDLLAEVAEDQLPQQLGGKYEAAPDVVKGLERLS